MRHTLIDAAIVLISAIADASRHALYLHTSFVEFLTCFPPVPRA